MDETLKSLLANAPNPVEKLIELRAQDLSGWLIHMPSLSSHFLKTGERIVRLECGHFALTRARFRAGCARCGQMIRSGHDHDGFRRMGMPDEMAWPDDPLRSLNEPDL